MPQGLSHLSHAEIFEILALCLILAVICDSCLSHTDDAKSTFYGHQLSQGGEEGDAVFQLMYFSYPHMFMLWKHTFLSLSSGILGNCPEQKQTDGLIFLTENLSSFNVARATSQTYSVMWQRSYTRHLCFCQVQNLILKKVRWLYFFFFFNGFKCNTSLQFLRISTELNLKK